MAHEAVWRRTMPVLLTRLEEGSVARLEDLDGAAAALRSPDPEVQAGLDMLRRWDNDERVGSAAAALYQV